MLHVDSELFSKIDHPDMCLLDLLQAYILFASSFYISSFYLIGPTDFPNHQLHLT